MASLLIRGVFKTRPMLLLTKCETSILSYENFSPKKQIKKFFYSQTIKQHEVKSFNMHQRDQVSREIYFLLSKILKCSQDEVESLTRKHPRLETMFLQLLEEQVNLLLSYNLPLSLITKNVRPLLNTSHDELSRRLELLQARSLLTDNPVRSQDRVFDSLEWRIENFDIVHKNMCDELDALEECANKFERIAEIFRCNQKDVDSLITQHPYLGAMSIPLLEQKVNLLLSYNLPLSLITKNPRPLYISHEELNRRLKLLHARSLLTDNLVRSQDKVFNYLAFDGKEFDIAYRNMCDELDALEGCANTKKITKNVRPLLHTSHEELSRRLKLLQARSLLTDNPVISQDQVFNYLGCDGKKFDIGYKNMCDELDALEGCANKSERIAEIFHCNQKDVDSLITQHPSLETMSIPLLEQKVKLLLSYNLPLSLITKNPRPLYISHEELSRRLELLQARSLLTDNPVRSQDKVFNYLGCGGKQFDVGYKNMCDELDALEGCANKSERIAEIFHCNQKDVDSLITQHPDLRSISVPLLEKIVQLLSLSLITKNVKPLDKYSVCKLKQRLELMQAAGIPVDNYLKLCEKNETYKRLNADLVALGGCKTESEYLQKRLKISKETADKFLSSTKLNGTSISKIKSVLDFFDVGD
ncbi:uncharacterized protein LOC131956172 [Physella acuta]|uniref:uncharacterized protein LOC131956172 n=1 Tax=Physella acuta TaxID=109671 RepID=UPI0027DD1E2B|nr:uncharacterized protein LOC131956172 [Physella acuta]